MEAKSTLKSPRAQKRQNKQYQVCHINAQTVGIDISAMWRISYPCFYTFSLMEDDEKNNLQIPEDPQRKTWEAEED